MTAAKRKYFLPVSIAAASLLVLAGCAQIPAGADASCAPTTDFAVTHTPTGDEAAAGPAITHNSPIAATLAVTLADGTEFLPETTVVPATGTTAPLFYAGLLTEGGLPGVEEALTCAQAGDEVVATMSLGQLLGEAGSVGFDQATLDEQVTLTAQVHEVLNSSAVGRIAPQHNGIPAVVSAPDGTPGVTMPQEDAPGDVRTATIVSGFGDEVVDGDQLVVHVQSHAWSTGDVLSTTWNSANQAAQFAVAAGDGFTEYLIGESIGSRVVLVMPAQALEAAGLATSVIGEGDAAVFVIDLLGSAPTAE